MSKLKKIILSALLLSILIVLSRFVSIKTPILVISLSFLPIMTAAIVLGPKYSCIIAALGDLIGALLFPFGTYFVGFTIEQALIGLIYGLFLYKNNKSEEERELFFKGKKLIIRLLISSFIVLGIIELPCMSLMLHLLYGKAFIAVLSSRILAKAVLFPIQIIVMFFLSKFIEPLAKKYLYNE